MHRDMAGLEHGPDLHSEGLAALVAFVGADTSAFALELADPINPAAMGAYRAVWPQTSLYPFVSGCLIVKVFGAQDGSHVGNSYKSIIKSYAGYVKDNISHIFLYCLAHRGASSGDVRLAERVRRLRARGNVAPRSREASGLRPAGTTTRARGARWTWQGAPHKGPALRRKPRVEEARPDACRVQPSGGVAIPRWSAERRAGSVIARVTPRQA
jgi:hypothetical protein